MAKGVLCISTTKKGLPCPTPRHGVSDYCVGHDPAITKEMRQTWIKKSAGRPHPTHAEYRFMNAQEIIEYASNKIGRLEEKYGDSIEAVPCIAEFLRVLIQANRILRDKDALRLKKDTGSGLRTVRIVRDEPLDPRTADAG